MYDIFNTKQSNSKKTFVVAEIGINHNGDMNLAKELIIAASEAGADSVKFQNYKTEDFINDKNLKLEFELNGKKIIKSQYDIFKKCELNRDKLLQLKELSDSLDLVFHSSPTSVQGLEDLKSIGCKIIKNGSDYLTNLRLIRAMGETGLLTVISTGMSTYSEIDLAVRTFRETGNQKLLLLHCTSAYPTKPEEVNLNRINTLREEFNVDVGFSDHTNGITASVGAVMFGATWIEKHFTLSKELPGPDHWFSMNPKELISLVDSIRHAERLIGSGHISPTKSESISRKEFRLSCVASKNLEIGTILSKNDIEFKRPGNGIPPSLENNLLGKRLNYPLKKGHQLQYEYLDEK